MKLIQCDGCKKRTDAFGACDWVNVRAGYSNRGYDLLSLELCPECYDKFRKALSFEEIK